MKSLVEALKTKPEIQVGVFGEKAHRRNGKLTNADVAMFHEYGNPEHNLPRRSMLRDPISTHAKEIMAPFKTNGIKFLEKGSLVDLYKLIGIACEKIVQQAFDTSGFGTWPALQYSTMLAKLKGSLKKRKGQLAQVYTGETGQGILIDTGQLRRAFSSRVLMRF